MPISTKKITVRSGDSPVSGPNGLLIGSGTTSTDLAIVAAGVLVDIDPPTIVDALSKDFVAGVDGSIQYTGPGLEAKIIFLPSIELVATTGAFLDLILLRNDVQVVLGNGRPETTGNAVIKPILHNIDLVTNDIIRSQVANLSSGIQMRCREFYMEIAPR